MSDLQATVEDPTVYQDMGTSLLVKPDGSNKAVAMIEQLAPERKSDLGSGEVNTEGRVTKYLPYEIKQSSPYELFGEVYNQLDSFISDTEETENITRRVEAEIRCGKTARERTEQGDKQEKAKKKGNET
ncbi:hypothetical protein K469DRAFT_688090 [Zopfia rhizophila CBS 207.26]|uniref:Uncharacterized protein n=1 Tax=Zopfia rhizophila CBS 207.26 TaxID=1314779 RepID=A0A6A6E446_9PEZI|nr:hypothetical protein K469DRAFT_688090 [Zopfia rhizophila CBS 207.26]